MGTNSKVNVIETGNFSGLNALIEADIATEEASGFGISHTKITQFLDPSDGSTKAIATLTYNKTAGGGSAGGESLVGVWLRTSTTATKYASVALALNDALPGDVIDVGIHTEDLTGISPITVPDLVCIRGSTCPTQAKLTAAWVLGNFSRIENIRLNGIAGQPVVKLGAGKLIAGVDRVLITGADAAQDVLQNEIEGGALFLTQCVYEAGTAKSFMAAREGATINTTSGAVIGGTLVNALEADSITPGKAGIILSEEAFIITPGATLTNGLLAGECTVNMNGFTATPAVNGIRITDPDHVIRISNMIGNCTTFDILVDGSVTVGDISVISSALRESKFSFPTTYLEDASLLLDFVDSFDSVSREKTIWGAHHIGNAERAGEAWAGEGGPEVRTMRVQTFDGVSAWVDRTAVFASSTGSTADLFAGVAAGNEVYIGSTNAFEAMETTTTVAGVIGAGEIITEYWNGSSWASVPTFASNVATQEDYANTPYERAAKEYVRTGEKPGFAASSIAGSAITDTLYWKRHRIVTAITTSPTLEQMRLIHNSSKESGLIREMFGTCEKFDLYWVGTGEDMSIPSGGANGPTDLSVNISANISYQQEKSLYAGNSDRSAGTMIARPAGIDTSRPQRLRVLATMIGSDTNDVDLEVYVADIRDGVAIGTLPEVPVIKSVTPPGAIGEPFTIDFDFVLPDILAGDLISFAFHRKGAADLNPNGFGALSFSLGGYFWK